MNNMSDDLLFQDTAQCPGCGAHETRKHGKHLGKQRYYCKKCGLAFTGGAYHYRPAQEVAALKQENQNLFKIVEAARRLNVALTAHLKVNSGKSLSNLKAKKERFSRLLAAGPHLERNADEQETSSETQLNLFD